MLRSGVTEVPRYFVIREYCRNLYWPPGSPVGNPGGVGEYRWWIMGIHKRSSLVWQRLGIWRYKVKFTGTIMASVYVLLTHSKPD
jgi:hypothetical protein